MTVDEAARRLRDLYQDAPEGEKVCYIHLFGIAYADKLGDMSISEVVERAGIHNSYSSEVSKGRKLGQYMVLNDETVFASPWLPASSGERGRVPGAVD